jgi:hypothetical protein
MADALAAQALKILRAEESIIQETLGLPLTTFSIVLHGPMASANEYDADVRCPDDHAIGAMAMLETFDQTIAEVERSDETQGQP